MIICAALEIQVEGLPYTTIIPCWRHSTGYEILRDLGFQAQRKYEIKTEGFIDHNGKFINRKEALAHAITAGQLSATNRWYQEDHNLNELYSEDLY